MFTAGVFAEKEGFRSLEPGISEKLGSRLNFGLPAETFDQKDPGTSIKFRASGIHLE